MKSRVLVVSFCLLLFICLFFIAGTNAASVLSLTVTTDRPFYRLQTSTPSTINVGGNLTLNGAPVSGGLVAITVYQGKPGHYVRPVLFRTIATGPLPPQNWSLNLSMNVVGQQGIIYVPQTVFTRPSDQNNPGPAFNVTYKNTASYTLTKLYLALTIFDSAKVPIATINVTPPSQTIPPGAITSIIVPPTSLKNWVALGNATAYISAFDNLPPYFYFPYCPEASSQFTIIASGGGQMSSQQERVSTSINGNYNMAFNLSYAQTPSQYKPWGNYTIEVSSSYQGLQAVDSYTFWSRIPGDINGDGKVGILDVNPIAFWWAKNVPPAPAYIDLNGDHRIGIQDVNPVAFFWGKTEQRLP